MVKSHGRRSRRVSQARGGHDGKQLFYEVQVRLMVHNGALTAAQDMLVRSDEVGGKLVHAQG